MSSGKELSYTEHVAAPPAHVYRAFATAQGLQEWMADVVEAEAREGGRFYAWWNAGYYAVGMYQAAEKDRAVQFTWQGRGDPGPTVVHVELEPRDGGTQLTLRHGGLGEGEGWDRAEENYNREWPNSFTNLKSVLETGVDRRLYDRPMLGFFIGGLVDEPMQKRLGLAVDYGMHVSGTVEGMGAERSGLKANDVIAEIAGAEIRTFPDVGAVLSRFKGGDTVQTVVYRGAERMEIEVELSKRPVPEFPDTAEALAKAGRAAYKKVMKDLRRLLKGATEGEAGQRPSEGEWSAREVMAHLLISERWTATAWDVLPEGGKSPSYPGSRRTTEAIAATYSTKQLYKELKRSIAHNLHMIETLPESYVANKAAWFLMASGFEDGIRNHFAEHVAQVRTALEAVRTPESA